MQIIEEYEKTQDSWGELLKPKRRVLGILPKEKLSTKLMREANKESYLLAEREVSQLFELSDMIDINNEELKKIRQVRERFNSELREMYPSLDWEREKNERLQVKPKNLGNLRRMERVLPRKGKEREKKSKLEKKPNS